MSEYPFGVFFPVRFELLLSAVLLLATAINSYEIFQDFLSGLRNLEWVTGRARYTNDQAEREKEREKERKEDGKEENESVTSALAALFSVSSSCT